jgi:predicted transcriptional regulator
MVRNYKKKNPEDFLKRGPKTKQLDEAVIAEIYRQQEAGVKIKRICHNLNLSYYFVNKTLRDKELHEHDAFEVEIAALG